MRDGTRPSTSVMELARRLVLIGGTGYAGEVKKSAFSVMNYLLPKQQVMPMHCSANYGGATRNDAALFFGLSKANPKVPTEPRRPAHVVFPYG